jgi:23S rRNA (cytidine2498-2'-O)-methyltransferase
MSESSFLFACCQVGAEAALKREMEQQRPAWRFAFSRPGFLTFKVIGPLPPPGRFQLKSVFARTFGCSIGPMEPGAFDSAIEKTRASEAETPFGFLHIWPRDTQIPGQNGFVPGTTPEAETIGAQLIVEGVRQGIVADTARVNGTARIGQQVWDLILLDPDRWWLGWHTASCFVHRWPGGVLPIHAPEEMVSRAYLKTREALAWSGLPTRPGDRCLEIGSAPGGSCQALLEQGLYVTGVDPSEMHPRVLQHPHFVHVQKRGADLRRRDLRGFKWMLVDSNVAPQQTLDTVESLVTHPATSFQGLVLTLKFPDWKLADRVAEYADRVRSWGFSAVRCRQLAYQRQEICLAALRHRTQRRLPRRKS